MGKLSRYIPLSLLAVVFTTVATLNFAKTKESSEGSALQVGVAEADITPPVGYPIAGYFHERLATGTLDPLKAKAVVFHMGEEKAALVVCDFCSVSVDLASAIRSRAEKETGIPAKNIVVSATHSHTAPSYSKDLFQYLSGELKDGDRADYITKLIDGPVAAIVEADKSTQRVTLEAGTAIQEEAIAFNRRSVLRDGSARTWISQSDPKVVRDAGPIDPEVGLVMIRDQEKKPLGVLSNFALHTDTVGGTKWSGDFPYYVERAIRKKHGEDVVSIFCQGACGDINHVSRSTKERNKTDFIGESLGATILKKLGSLEPVEQSSLQVRSRIVKLPVREVTPQDLAEAKKVYDTLERKEKVDFYDTVRARQSDLRQYLRNGTSINDGVGSRTWEKVGDALPVEVHTISIGRDLAIVCLPGEVFVDLGLAIKRGSPFRTTLIVELSNCSETCYIPTRAAYAQGSYEVTNSAVKPGSGEMLVEAALELLREAASTDLEGE